MPHSRLLLLRTMAFRQASLTARIQVAFDPRQMRISCVGSSKLKYEVKKNGQCMIHTNHMGWMRYLSGDIGRDLQLVTAGDDAAGGSTRRLKTWVARPRTAAPRGPVVAWHAASRRSRAERGLAKLARLNRRVRR